MIWTLVLTFFSGALAAEISWTDFLKGDQAKAAWADVEKRIDDAIPNLATKDAAGSITNLDKVRLIENVILQKDDALKGLTQKEKNAITALTCHRLTLQNENADAKRIADSIVFNHGIHWDNLAGIATRQKEMRKRLPPPGFVPSVLEAVKTEFGTLEGLAQLEAALNGTRSHVDPKTKLKTDIRYIHYKNDNDSYYAFSAERGEKISVGGKMRLVNGKVEVEWDSATDNTVEPEAVFSPSDALDTLLAQEKSKFPREIVIACGLGAMNFGPRSVSHFENLRLYYSYSEIKRNEPSRLMVHLRGENNKVFALEDLKGGTIRHFLIRLDADDGLARGPGPGGDTHL